MPATRRLQPDQQRHEEHSSIHEGLVQCTLHYRGTKSDALNDPRLSPLHGVVHNRSVRVVTQLCSCVCMGVRVGVGMRIWVFAWVGGLKG